MSGSGEGGQGALAGLAGARWRMAVDRWQREGIPVSISVLGDSITDGSNCEAGKHYQQAFAALLRQFVRNWLGGDELEFIHLADSDDPRLTTTGTWTTVNQGPRRCARRTTSGGTKKFGPVFASHFVIVYINEEGGDSLVSKIDEGAFGNGASTNGPPLLKAKVASAGSTDFHSITFKPNGTTKPVTVVGVAALVAGKGAANAAEAHRVYRLGKPGARVGDFTGNESALDALTTGFTVTGFGGGSLSNGADLSVLAFTTNDFDEQTPLATYKANLETLAKKGLEFGSVLVVALPEPNETKAIPWTSYRDTAAEVALALGCGFLDLNTPWGGKESTVYKGLMNDAFHPGPLGHRDLGLRLFEAIHFPVGATYLDRLRSGVVILAGGSAVVKTPKVTANSRISLTCQVPGGTPGSLRIATRTAEQSFEIASSDPADTSTVAWQLAAEI